MMGRNAAGDAQPVDMNTLEQVCLDAGSNQGTTWCTAQCLLLWRRCSRVTITPQYADADGSEASRSDRQLGVVSDTNVHGLQHMHSSNNRATYTDTCGGEPAAPHSVGLLRSDCLRAAESRQAQQPSLIPTSPCCATLCLAMPCHAVLCRVAVLPGCPAVV
jgi:hypothetical protein